MIDIEVVMDDIKAIVTSNIQTYINEINTDKPNSIIPNFDSGNYHLWELRDVPNRRVSFLQMITDDPSVDSQGSGNILIYPIQINCMWRIQSRDELSKIKARYHWILIKVLSDKVARKYNDLRITDVNSVLAAEEDTEDNLVEFIFVKFNIGITI